MKYLYFIFALLTFSSCEIRSTNFDPDNQRVSDDELAQIAIWDQYQTERLSNAEYERLNAHEFIGAEFDSRQNTKGKWIIEGSITNSASEIHFKDVQLVLSYYNDSNDLIGTEDYVIRDYLAPGDRSRFYFKSDKYDEAHSMSMEVSEIETAS